MPVFFLLNYRSLTIRNLQPLDWRGCQYDVDLNMLIQEVVIDPSAPDWLLDLVSSVADRYNLQAAIKKSHLAALPTWFPPDRIDEVLPQEDE